MGIQVRQLGLAALLAASVAGGVAAQQQGPVAVTQPIPPVVEPQLDQAQAQAQADLILAYWTPERMASAQAAPTPTRLVENSPRQESVQALPAGDPVTVSGQRPGGGPHVENKRVFTRSQMRAASQSFGAPPSNPRDGPYGPFQRWTMEGNYLGGWRGIHGKLFFTLNATNYVCSGTVIGRSTIATAGHCNYGSGSFATNRQFCPSYYNPTPTTGAPHPARGCWVVVTSSVGGPWASGADPDYDYSCLVTNVTGTVVADKIGNVTGWAGRAYNWTDVPEMQFGYPQGFPFLGNSIQQVATAEWYNWDATAGDQVSKIIGSDLTGGASGGGWFLGWRAGGGEIPDTDGSNATDPATAGPFLNGMNSHKRCLTNCQDPPSTTAGLFWQEMTSPPFRSDTADASDSEDIFALCLTHANNN